MTDTQIQTGVVLTDVAVQKVRALLEAEGRTDLSLRIAVQPGGCSGLRYQLYFDDRQLDGDVETDYDGVLVVTDKMSAPYLGGASIDFVEDEGRKGRRSHDRQARAVVDPPSATNDFDREHDARQLTTGRGLDDRSTLGSGVCGELDFDVVRAVAGWFPRRHGDLS